jgi:hypothetical protein
MRRALVTLWLLLGCVNGETRPPSSAVPISTRDAMSFLSGTLKPWPRTDSTGLLAITDPATGRVATYDSALVVLALLRADQRERAARVLQGLAALQGQDGGVPFSFTLPAPDPQRRYERAGAIAWIGYAAAEYLDAEKGGPARDVALALAQRAAAYLLAHQVTSLGDPRYGLVRGGFGTIRYEVDGDAIREVFEPGEIAWASVEHNIDAYFAFRALARVTEMRMYQDAARRIADGLVARAWSGIHGQFVEGVDAEALDPTLALDCAAWGAVLLGAIGDSSRADTALAIADGRYASADGRRNVRGHRPYARGPVLADERLMRHFAATLAETTWEKFDVVWPEGSAGVALAAWRAGRVKRARAILDALELLRSPDGSLPTSTTEVPLLLDTRPSIAGTAWVALVRFELDRPLGSPTLWAP